MSSEGRITRADVEPWKDRETLRRYYHERELSCAKTAKHLGCSGATVGRWLKRTDLGVRDLKEATLIRYGTRYEVPMNVDRDGVVRWAYWDGEVGRTITVHRLLAVAKYGLDAVADNAVHHINEVRWDNRPENITLMEHGEHSAHHKQKVDWLEKLRATEMYREGASSYDICPTFGVHPGTVIEAVRDVDADLIRPVGGA